MRDLPTGTVTFLFTDIEGSTRLLRRLGDRYRELVDGHGRILRAAIVEGGGAEIRTEGDSFFAVFATPAGALAAAVQAQRALAAHRWPDSQSVMVRMGLHTGEGVLGTDDYIGLDVHLAARIAAAGHGGQVLLSEATRALVEHTLPDGVSLRDLGRHRLKGHREPRASVRPDHRCHARRFSRDPYRGCPAHQSAAAADLLRRPGAGGGRDHGPPGGGPTPHPHRAGWHRQDPAAISGVAKSRRALAYDNAWVGAGGFEPPSSAL
ncbi:MAG: adenylate/guanylate cyclase domain-containing protein [Actinomycetota bacterium]